MKLKNSFVQMVFTSHSIYLQSFAYMIYCKYMKLKILCQIFLRRISQSEIRISAAAEKSESESEGGQKFLPPNPLPFCPPERSVSAARSATINRSFVQNRFELRSVIATNQDISNFQGKELARSPPPRRGPPPPKDPFFLVKN